MGSYQRFSTVTIKEGSKRPEVFSYQGALRSLNLLSGKVDGWYGKKSAQATRAFQHQVNEEAGEQTLTEDGKIGKNTATELLRRATGFTAPLEHRIMAVIAFYEVGGRQDAFGMAVDDIGDSAGANYGIFQCNSHGSVKAVLTLASRSDLVQSYESSDKSVINPKIQQWFGSSEGIAAQVEYFHTRTFTRAMAELRELASFDAWEQDPAMKSWWERAVLMFCDTKIQNGGMWSNKRTPFLTELAGTQGHPAAEKRPELFHGEWWDELLGAHLSYADLKTRWAAEFSAQLAELGDEKSARKATNRAVAKQLIEDIPADQPSLELVALAQLRARSSSPKWWYQAVVRRRMTDATGAGRVNGAELDLSADFQL